MTENPQTPEGQQGDSPEAHIAGTGSTEGATERIPQPTAASPETPITSPTGADSPAEQQPPQAPGVAPSTASPSTASSGAAFGPAATASYPTAEYPNATTAAAGATEASAGQGAERKTASRRIAVPVIGALAIGALIGGGTGAGIYALASGNNTHTVSTTTAQGTTSNVTINRSQDATTVTAVAAKSAPSVVTINVTGDSSAGTGSGVILSKDGYVLTNNHVVTLEGATSSAKVSVTASDGRIYTATVVGTDPIVDLAVIKLDKATDLAPMTFADSSNLNVGDTAIAIGAPLGLSGTVTDGIVSALNRSISIASSAVPKQQGDSSQGNNNSQGPFDFWNFGTPGQQGSTSGSSSISLPVIQTDAAINPGNSGGALLNGNGELMGVNVAIASAGSTSGGQGGSIGVGFAIPANLAKRVADEIIATGSATHGLLGASVGDAATSAPGAGVAGAYISDVVSGGSAAAAGLQKGDVVTKFNGVPITSPTDLTAQVRSLAAGGKAELVYVRNGQQNTVSVTLGQLKL